MNDAESSFYQKLHADPGPFEGGARQGLFSATGAPEEVAAHSGIGAAAASPTPKKKSRKRAYIYGGLGTGFIVVGLAVATYIDMTSQQPASSASIQAAQALTPALSLGSASAGLNAGSGVMASENAPPVAGAESGPSTVMGGADVGSGHETTQAPQAAAVVPAQPTLAEDGMPAAVNAVPGQNTAASPVGAGSAAAQLAVAPVEMKQVALKPSSVVPSEPSKDTKAAKAEETNGASDEALMKRLAALEKEIADLRARDDRANRHAERRVTRTAKPASAKNNGKSEQLAKVDEPKSTLREVSRTGGKAASENVRILGVTMRPVGSMALIEFAGVKQRYAEGDSVPGLGTVGAVALQDGLPTVTINGVVYR